MAQKKKKQDSTTGIAFLIFLMSLGIVWILSSCDQKPSDLLEGFRADEAAQTLETDEPIQTEQEEHENTEQETQALQEELDQSEEPDMQEEENQEPAELVENTATEPQVQDAEGETDGVEQDLNLGEDAFSQTEDLGSLSNETFSWSFKRNEAHEPTTGYTQGIAFEDYGAYYKVETSDKMICLTFDEGYENGYTARILDILKENGVQAAFFVTQAYIESEPELCARMKAEGHIVGNHTANHPSMPDLSDEDVLAELTDTRMAFETATGYEMDPFFRFPMGEFSERTLYLVRSQGYRSIFWSLAMMDWDVNNQPGADYVHEHLLANHHPGAIFLLHAVSQSVTDALDVSIKDLKAQGYRFASLYEVE